MARLTDTDKNDYKKRVDSDFQKAFNDAFQEISLRLKSYNKNIEEKDRKIIQEITLETLRKIGKMDYVLMHKEELVKMIVSLAGDAAEVGIKSAFNL